MHNSYIDFASYLTPILFGFKYEYPQMSHTPDDRWRTPASLTFYVNRVHGHCLRQLSDCQWVAKRAFLASETGCFSSWKSLFRSPKQPLSGHGIAHTVNRTQQSVL